MTESQWSAFCEFRVQMKAYCNQLDALGTKLYPLQSAAAKKDTPEYPIQTPVVYNTAYDSVTKDDEIRLLVIGDNPGKEEQLEKNRRYLVGQSGRIAEGFFRRNGELGIDFRKNALILNKTPIHTAKTAHLRTVAKEGDSSIKNALLDSQVQMARLTARLHQSLVMGTDCPQDAPELWLVGYAELKGKGIFLAYRDELKNAYLQADGYSSTWDKVRVFQHFSMNRFLVDLSKWRNRHPDMDTVSAVRTLGICHRDEIFA